MSQNDDFYYLDLILAGDVSAYRWIVDKYKDQSCRLALQLVKNKEDAEEIVQDAFVRAFHSVHKFNRTASFSTWLFRIVYNGCIDKIRKKSITTSSLSEMTGKEFGSQIATDQSGLMRDERKKYVDIAISALSVEEQALVSLFYVHEKDMNEISNILNLTHGNVRKRMTRVREKLKGTLEKMLNTEITNLL